MYTIQETPSTYEKLSITILKKIVELPARDVLLIFDQYFSPSIKDYERNKRGKPSSCQYRIIADMTFTNILAIELNNINFKIALVQFLIEHWQRLGMAPFFEDKTIFINYDQCYEYKIQAGQVTYSINPLFTSPRHEKAGTKIVHTVCNLDRQANALIKCEDTDIVIILLGNIDKLKFKLKIIVEFGVSDDMRLIDI